MNATGSIAVDTGILYPALRKAGITLAPGRTPSPAQYKDALDELNRLLGSLNLDRLFIYSLSIVTAPVTSAKTYTIGIAPSGSPAADIVAPRPIAIESANLIKSNLRYAIELITAQEWAAISLQNIVGIPYALYNDGAAPLSTLYLFPQSAGGDLLELYYWHAVDYFVAASDVAILPPGYDDALVLNLALRLAPQFQRQLDPQLRIDARDSLMRIRSINAPRPILDTSGALDCGCNDFNIFRG